MYPCFVYSSFIHWHFVYSMYSLLFCSIVTTLRLTNVLVWNIGGIYCYFLYDQLSSSLQRPILWPLRNLVTGWTPTEIGGREDLENLQDLETLMVDRQLTFPSHTHTHPHTLSPPLHTLTPSPFPTHNLHTDVYVLTTEVLGQGAHSSVSTCHHKITGQEFAVKVATVVPASNPK